MTDHYTAAHRLPHAPGSTRAWNRSTVVRKRQIPATSLATPSSMVLLPEGAERFWRALRKRLVDYFERFWVY